MKVDYDMFFDGHDVFGCPSCSYYVAVIKEGLPIENPDCPECGSFMIPVKKETLLENANHKIGR